MSNADNIYQTPLQSVPRFEFNSAVANVFPDMIKRSVPGYQQILGLLPSLVRFYINANREKSLRIYDLGCSHGAALLAAAIGVEHISTAQASVDLIGLDTSKAMIEHAVAESHHFPKHLAPHFEVADITNYTFKPCNLVMLQYTLQFIPIEHRQALINDIADAMRPGGILILSEKLAFEDEAASELLTGIHHRFKRDQGYSELEISQKRDAIEKVLIPERLESHIHRLRSAGFSVVTPWIQNIQFTSILAVK